MGKRVKIGGRDFQVGHPGGPGRPKMPKELKEIRALTCEQASNLGTFLLYKTTDDLRRIESDPKSSAFSVLFSGLILKAIEEKDHRVAESVLDRIVGKPALIQITQNTQNNIHTEPIHTTKEEREKILSAMVKFEECNSAQNLSELSSLLSPPSSTQDSRTDP